MNKQTHQEMSGTQEPPPPYPYHHYPPPLPPYAPGYSHHPHNSTPLPSLYAAGVGNGFVIQGNGFVIQGHGMYSGYPQGYQSQNYLPNPQVVYAVPQQIQVVPPINNVVYALPPPMIPCACTNSYPNRNLQLAAAACAALFVFGLFTWFFYLFSVVISLHMVRKRYISNRRLTIIVLSILELHAWCFVPAFIWYSTDACVPNALYPSEENCYVQWWGWIPLVTFALFAFVFGIPRVVLTFRYDQKDTPQRRVLVI